MDNFNFNEFAGNSGRIFESIKAYAVKAGRATTKTLLELYYVMIDKDTSGTDRLLIGAALAYQVLPTDLLPRSKYGLLGFLDNAVAISFAYKRVQKAITPSIERKVEETLDKWFGSSDKGYTDVDYEIVQ